MQVVAQQYAAECYSANVESDILWRVVYRRLNDVNVRLLVRWFANESDLNEFCSLYEQIGEIVSVKCYEHVAKTA